MYSDDGGASWKESASIYNTMLDPNGQLIEEPVSEAPEPIDKGEKYLVTLRDRTTGDSIEGDVYDVLEAYKITCPSMAHAIKKLLLAGKRGAKGFDKDCDEGINSIEQSKLLEKWR